MVPASIATASEKRFTKARLRKKKSEKASSQADTGTAAAASGYSIVEAADLAGAEALTAGHPYLSEGKGDFAIDIYEMLPVPL